MTLHEYARFGTALRARGFNQGTVAADPICRYRQGNLILDILPVSPTVLGFGNLWYPLAVETAVRSRLPGGLRLKHATAPCFMATKLVAFRDRGGGDFLASRDFEDLVAVVEGRPEIVDEVRRAPAELRTWLRHEMGAMIGERGFAEGLVGMIPGFADVRARAELVRGRFVDIAEG